MADKEHRTVLTIDAKTTNEFKRVPEMMKELAAQLNKQAGDQGINKVFENGARMSDRYTVKIDKQGAAVVKLNRSFSQVGKTEQQLSKEREKAARVQEQIAAKTQRAAEKNETWLNRVRSRSFRDEQKEAERQDRKEQRIKARFGQGMLQGLSMPGLRSYIPSAGGWGAVARQGMGYAIGHTARGVGLAAGGTLMGGAFNGLQGIQQAISGLPWGAGGILGGQVGMGIAAAGDALGQIRDSRQLINLNPSVAAAEAQRNNFMYNDKGLQSGYSRYQRDRLAEMGATTLGPQLGIGTDESVKTVMNTVGRVGQRTDARDRLNRNVTDATQTALVMQAGGLNPSFAGAAGRASGMGISTNASLGFANTKALWEAIGGNLADLNGVMEELTNVIEQNTKIGAPTNVGRFASGIAMGAAFNMNPMQAKAFGGGVQGRMSDIGQGGVKNEQDMMLMQLFGFEGKGIPKNLTPMMLLEERARMKNKGVSPEVFFQGVEKGGALSGGNLAAFATALGSAIPGLDPNMLVQLAKGEQVDVRGNLEGIAGRRNTFRQGRGPSGARLTPSELSRDAETNNMRINAGYKALNAVQNVEETQVKTFDAMATTFGPAMEKVSEIVKQFGEVMQAVIKAMGESMAEAKMDASVTNLTKFTDRHAMP